MYKLPKGIKIGHADNGTTGVTVILCERQGGYTAGCDVRGGAPGTRETDLLKSEKAVQSANAIVLSGGSAYGLESACGVMDYLREHGCGFKVMGKIVPIVPAAVIFDLNGDDYVFPDKKMGYEACQNATSTPTFGSVGGGTGATVGKIRMVKHTSRGGIGAATVKVLGINVTAVVVVNAFGDVYDEKTGKIIAGAKGNKAFLNTEKTILDGSIAKLLFGGNTTIGCIITSAKLTKVQANKLAGIGHNGLARSISPVHTDYDGDTLFCLATGKKKVLNFAFLQTAAVEAVRQAVINAVSGGGQPFPAGECEDTDDEENAGENDNGDIDDGDDIKRDESGNRN